MNFLAHFTVATRFHPRVLSLPAYTVGTALPDLLPLAAAHTRLRPQPVTQFLANSLEDQALRAGVLSHLAADAAWHKTQSFADSQAEAGLLLAQAGFREMRVRRFFFAHILVELALDAALLRANSAVGEDFYAAFSAADMGSVTGWTEAVLARPLPELPFVLKHFAASRYLLHYRTDEGVAEGLSRLCARVRQDTFEGKNYVRLTRVVGKTVQMLMPQVSRIVSETTENISQNERLF